MLYALIIFSFVFLIWSLFMLKKSSTNRKKALYIVHTKTLFKLLPFVISFVALYANYPQSIYFLAFFISLIIGCFSIDIMITDNGLCYGTKTIAWNNLEKADDRPSYIYLKAKNNVNSKKLSKLIWNFQKDITHKINLKIRENTKFSNDN